MGGRADKGGTWNEVPAPYGPCSCIPPPPKRRFLVSENPRALVLVASLLGQLAELVVAVLEWVLGMAAELLLDAAVELLNPILNL